jgi:universal stress protein A
MKLDPMDISRILAPVDFSDCSRASLEDALVFAERFGAELEVLHVWELPRNVRPDLMVWMEGRDGQNVGDVVRDQAEADLAAFLGTLSGKAKLSTRVEGGDPVDRIVHRAAEGKFDLLVLGTHGRTGVQHLVMGSVAEKVVRRAPCPVLTVRQK